MIGGSETKVNVAILLQVIHNLHEEGLSPKLSTRFIFSNFEEVGHGVTALPPTIKELIALDIGTVGEGRNSREEAVTIVAKDSRTPYPLPLKKRLVQLARQEEIAYRVDTHLRYGSDGSIGAIAALDIDFSCFGPGVDATHHYERTHREGILASCELLRAYLIH